MNFPRMAGKRLNVPQIRPIPSRRTELSLWRCFVKESQEGFCLDLGSPGSGKHVVVGTGTQNAQLGFQLRSPVVARLANLKLVLDDTNPDSDSGNLPSPSIQDYSTLSMVISADPSSRELYTS